MPASPPRPLFRGPRNATQGVVGVDGYPRGWVAVALAGGRFERVALCPSFPDVLDEFADAAAFGVDIPIGTGPRKADGLARAFIGPRRASVFAAPSREALAAATYAEARAVAPSLSSQAFALRRKILEVAPYASDPRVVEVHPEVSFRALRGSPLAAPKTTWNGFQERRRLLSGAGIELPDELDQDVPLVDLLDAAAAAWSAARYERGAAEALGDDAAAIWY